MKKKNQQANILRLIELFEERDKLYQSSTEQICDLIGPTTLEALIDVFNVPPENVTWLEVQLVEDILLLVASIAYDEGQRVPDLILALSPLPDDGQPSIRLFRVGLPVDLIFQPKTEILEYLKKASQLRMNPHEGSVPIVHDEESVEIPVHHEPQEEFDTSGLTHEQIQQMLVFGKESKGTKH